MKAMKRNVKYIRISIPRESLLKVGIKPYRKIEERYDRTALRTLIKTGLRTGTKAGTTGTV